MLVFRFVMLTSCFGMGAGIAGVTTGYWVDAQGFIPPVTLSAGIDFFVFFLIFLLPGSKKIKENKKETSNLITTKTKDDSKKHERQYGACEKPQGETNTSSSLMVIRVNRIVWRSSRQICLFCG